MITGISTACLYPEITEKSLEKLMGMGYKNFEVFINCPSEMKGSYIKQLKDIAGSDVKFCSVHPFTSGVEGMLFFSEYQRRFNDGKDFYKRFFEAAAQLGATNFVLHGQKNDNLKLEGRRTGGNLEDKNYFERYEELFSEAATFGITLCQENVRAFRSCSIEFVKAMKKELGNKCAFVFDIKQSIISGEDPLEMIKAMGSSLKHFHLSDCTQQNPCLLPGFGECNLQSIYKELCNINYEGAVITEVYSVSYADEKDIEKARHTVEAIFI